MNRLPHRLTAACLLCVAVAHHAAAAEPPPKRTFRHMLVGTLSMPGEEFLKYVERVRPELVVMGAFGAPQWAAQDDPRVWLEEWRGVFERMHKSDVKVIGMIELLNVGNSPADANKWLDFYNRRWDEELLGPRPKAAGASLLERRVMPPEQQTGAHAPRGCALNADWRSVEKALVAALIDAGIDGFITHRNMFGECGCPFCHADWDDAQPDAHAHQHTHKHDSKPAPAFNTACDHCRGGFRRWLSRRYQANELKARFSITDVKSHRLTALYGHHRDHEKLPSPLQLEGMKFARHAIKEAYDDVFVRFGRQRKADLIVAQWNHMPYFDELHLDGGHIPRWNMTTFAHASADERWSLPIKRWGRGEDFYWYCNWGTCQNTQLEKCFLADVTLYGRLLRSLARGKPYVINKYDFYRPRNMLAEAAALGMIAGAIAVPHATPEDADVTARYFDFLRRHAELYADSNGRTVAPVLMVFPRLATHAGDAEGLEMIEVAGRTMVVNHVQFDFVSDDLMDRVRPENYRVIVAAEPSGLEAPRLEAFYEGGGTLIAVPRTAAKAADPRWSKLRAKIVPNLAPHSGGKPAAEPLSRELLKALGASRAKIDAPYTVETHLYRQSDRYVLHLVNYNRTEKAPGRSVVEREAPIAASPVAVRLPLPAGVKIRRVTFLDPDADAERSIEFIQADGSVRFTTPSFLVYGMCVINVK